MKASLTFPGRKKPFMSVVMVMVITPEKTALI